MRLAAVISLGLLVAACEAPNVAEKFAETPVSTQICSFYIAAATELAQSHCQMTGANAELVGKIGQCDFRSGPGRSYSWMSADYPMLYNYRCVR